MSTLTLRPLNLARAEGSDLFTAADALLKGALESEVPVQLLIGPRRGPLGGLFDAQGDERVRAILQEHGLALLACADGARAVTLALEAAKGGRRAVAVVSNEDLDAAMPALERATATAPVEEGGLCVLLEDRPEVAPAACPRRVARRLDVPCIEPADVAGLRDGVEQALRLSRAGRQLVGMVVHQAILRTIDTLEARSNRVVGALDAVAAKRQPRRGPRPGEALDLITMARRLDLNRAAWLPNPGELASLGVIGIGAASPAMRHVLSELRLVGRVPLLHLGMVHPVDESIIERFLLRCRQVVVLEPRPGSIGELVALAAERARRRGAEPAHLWWDLLPPAGEQEPQRLGVEEALQPSNLARRMLHLLHELRPALGLADRLARIESGPVPQVAARGSSVEPARAAAELRTLLEELDGWARHPGPDAEERPSAGLVIDGLEQGGGTARTVYVEIWERRRFAREGQAAVRQAARESRTRILLVIDAGGEDAPDPERLARAAAPGERGEAVGIESASLLDRAVLRDLLRAAVQRDGLQVIIVRPGAREESVVEIDRLGFQPVQRIVWAADLAGDIRPLLPRTLHDSAALRSLPVPQRQVRSERIADRRVLGIRLRPRYEQVEVIRSRPPTLGLRADAPGRLAPPRPEHGGKGVWRAHVAGVRGRGPGVLAEVLCDAGRAMGYHVRCIHDAAPIGPGRRAWSQVLFTKPRPGEAPPPLTAQIPFGEADLILGVDPLEAMRAVGPDPELRVAALDRTSAVLNSGPLEDQLDAGVGEELLAVLPLVERCCMPQRVVHRDFARLCRDLLLTDRVVDVVLLGLAFQRGLIPLSLEALDAALRRAEQRGTGRTMETFAFGRRLAVAPPEAESAEVGANGRPTAEASETAAERASDSARHEPPVRLLRRMELDLRRQRWPRVRDRGDFIARVTDLLARTEALGGTELGRQARHDLVLAMRRCMAWGGLSHARRYARLIWTLFDADDAATGRELTCLAVLPLADALLPRDLLYLATMATSHDHRRRTRERLGVRTARGDQVDRRYLNRLDLMGFGWRLQVDFRTSDWPARMTTMLRPFVPMGWRGTRTERAVREYVVDLIGRAASESSDDPVRWSAIMRRLNTIAAENRLRTRSVEHLRALVEGGAAPPDDTASEELRSD